MTHRILTLMILSVCSKYCLALTRAEAFEDLQRSDKWKLTDTLLPEAHQNTVEIESELRPKTGLVFREFVARINPIQYGSNPGSNPITTVGFGTTAIESEWTIMDPLMQAKLLLSKAKEQSSTDQSLNYQNDLTALMLIQYLSVQKLKKQFELSQANLQKSELIFKLANAKHSVGAGIPLDVARAKNLVNLDNIKKMAAYTKYLKAKHDLSNLLGLERIDSDLEPLDAKIIKFESYQDVLKRALESRNDLKSSRKSIVSAQEAQRYANRKFFPKLQLIGQVGTTDITTFGLPGQTLNGYVGFNLIIPLDAAGMVEAKRAEARVMVSKTEIGLREKINEVSSEIKEAVENLTLAEEGLKAAKEYVTTAEEESSIAEKRFYSGASTGLDLTSAHVNLAQAYDNLNESTFNYEAAKVAYFKSLGNFKEYF